MTDEGGRAAEAAGLVLRAIGLIEEAAPFGDEGRPEELLAGGKAELSVMAEASPDGTTFTVTLRVQRA